MYLFKCKTCGEYPVSPPHFEQFVADPEVRRRLLLEKGDRTAVLDFGSKCPKCTPKHPSKKIVLVMRKKVS
jgi:hypothetical protein